MSLPENHPWHGKTPEEIKMSFVGKPELFRYSSTGRPWALLAWLHNDSFTIFHEERAKVFWATLQEEWSGFDLVPHRNYEAWMRELRPHWTPGPGWDDLPERFMIYRGQSECDPVGLSWTRDRDVALSFAYGHRGIRTQRPVIYEYEVPRNEVALVIDSRSESEIVLFEAPDEMDLEMVFTNDAEMKEALKRRMALHART